MFCSNCGKQIPDNSRFCENCGSRVGEEDTEFVGRYEDGVFELTGSGNLSIGPFYEYQGKYYGFGSLLTPDGTTADVLLMR